MQAFTVEAWGAPPALRELPSPSPGAGQVSVNIEACGLNFADLLMIEGRYQERPELPVTLGMELAGRVAALGPGVTGLTPGDRVAVFAGSGGLAETGCFPASSALKIPEATPATDAAALQIGHGTAHVALAHRARLAPGETLVVLGAAGGTGLAAVEIGRLMGARVIAVARGADRLQIAREAGAHEAIDSRALEAPGALRDAILALGGADVVYDPVGGAQFTEAMRAARPEARLLVIGFASGDIPQVKANHLLVKNISLLGFWWGGYMHFRPDVVRESLRQLFDWHAEGRIRPHVSHVLPLSRAAEGLELLRSRKATGKVVVKIG